MLNPQLHAVLTKHFGEVKISNEGVKRIERRRGNQTTVIVRGEHYNVCCPLCGDERFRLSVSYLWLTTPSMSRRRLTHLANCYNEDCDVRAESFYGELLDDYEAACMGLLEDEVAKSRKVGSTSTRQRGPIPLPKTLTPLNELNHQHVAIKWLQQHYRVFGELPVETMVNYLTRLYGVQWCHSADEMFPIAEDRLVFPVYVDGQPVGWQARSVYDEQRPRWYLPPGFVKTWYNGDRVAPFETPVLCEGVVNAIACGPKGIAMFGKQLNRMRAQEFRERWSSVIIATDPDTFVPDNRKGASGRIFAHELRDVLREFVPVVRMIRWPDDVLEMARRSNSGEEEGIKVPDAADLGFVTMRRLIEEASHAPSAA